MNIVLNIWTDSLVVVGLGFVMVFSILLLLVFIIQSLHKLLFISVSSRWKKAKAANVGQSDKEKEASLTVSHGESAAIALALHMYYFEEIHDEENAIITIKKIEKRYSPWNSKIYGLNQPPLK